MYIGIFEISLLIFLLATIAYLVTGIVHFESIKDDEIEYQREKAEYSRDELITILGFISTMLGVNRTEREALEQVIEMLEIEEKTEERTEK